MIYELKYIYNNMVDVYKISAITLIIENMKRSCNFYCRIPGFKLVYGGSSGDPFSTFQIGENKFIVYLNLESIKPTSNFVGNPSEELKNRYFGRIIFHTYDVDKLYSYFKNNEEISNAILFENEPKNAPWGERYFHIREPDGCQLSFAESLNK
jgi:catechol 2,3-dioxygenase-like lactoylglutathione lyase family enzyme